MKRKRAITVRLAKGETVEFPEEPKLHDPDKFYKFIAELSQNIADYSCGCMGTGSPSLMSRKRCRIKTAHSASSQTFSTNTITDKMYA